MFPIKHTVFLCTETLVKNMVRLIGNIEYVITILSKYLECNVFAQLELLDSGIEILEI